MPELLLELFSEEIPARLQARAAADLHRGMNARLLDAGLAPEFVRTFAGPRRLAAVVGGLPKRQPDRVEEKKGPRVGAPDAAVDGFLKSAGVSSLDACEQRQDKKGAYWVAVVNRPGRDVADILAEAIPELIRTFPWQKSMRWGDGDLRWVRPLKRILCVFDDAVLPFSVDGLASGDLTEGHRILSPGVVRARTFEAYAAVLKKAHVLLDSDERAELIAGEARTLCVAQGLELVEDKGLLAEVAGLVEWPVVMMGAFDAKFLALPDEVLTASMRGHQKYFSVRDPKTGRLANRFVFVANIEAKDGGASMRSGYERVLTARLSDAWYLYHLDLKRPLADRVADLGRVTFFEGLGTLADKARRVAALAREIAPAVGADRDIAERAALLAKADLVTGMVYEFPELQGVIGRYYAIEQDAPAVIADAIRDHYSPKGQDDEPPSEPVAVAVALADKIDTLTAFWAIDRKPTGSSDPFALRRAALGVIATILRNRVRLDLFQTFGPNFERLAAFDQDRINDHLRNASSLVEFFHERLRVHLREKGRRHDHVDAVLLDEDQSLHDDVTLIVDRLAALEAFLATDDGANLVAAYKRAANILKSEEKKGPLPSGDEIEASLLSLREEKALYEALSGTGPTVRQAVMREDFSAAMGALAAMRPVVDAFFDKVTVNADEPALRRNRLAILQRFVKATAQVADLSRLEG